MLRVLEVGGGTGSTRPSSCRDCRRTAPSTSSATCRRCSSARARQKFAAFPFVSYQALDLERDLTAQGVEPDSVDVVIASNVVHATRDVRRTLGNLRRVLRPGGLLVMVEVTAPLGGSTSPSASPRAGGGSMTRACGRRIRWSSRRQWLELLAQTGFADAAALPESTPARALSVQSVLLARAGGAAEERDAAASMARRRRRCRPRRDGGASARGARACGGSGRSRRPAGSGRRGGAGAPRRCRRGRDLLPRRRWPHGRPGGSRRRFAARAGARVRRPSALAQALIGVRRPATRACGSSHAELSRLAGPTTCGSRQAATLWGVGHTIAIEHPELRCVRVDLDPDAPAAASVDRLMGELAADDAEDRVGFRGSRRYVARLRRLALHQPPVDPSHRLVVARRGSLDGLDGRVHGPRCAAYGRGRDCRRRHAA